MKNKKTLMYAGIITLLVVILGVIIYMYVKPSNNGSNGSATGGFGSSTTTNAEQTSSTVTQKDKRGETTYTDYTAEINLSSVSATGTGVSIDGTTIKITAAGTYHFTGSLTDGSILIEAGDDDNVILVFDNVTLTSKTTAAINCVNAKNLYINLKEGTTNTLTDAKTYTVLTSDDEPDGAIYSKTDLKICGKGTLVVNANYGDGIVSKDDLVITDATIKVTSADDAIRGKDCVDIKDATITINATNDGIKSTNEDEDDKGYVLIDGGSITISAGDDGIHAETALVINSGTIDITKSYEGLEAALIEINGGKINVVASDDGINASDGSSQGEGMMMQSSSNSNVQIVINGGTIYVDAEGDGLDANGSIFMNGGSVTVAGTQSAGNGALDYDRTFNITGGELIVYGGTGMWQNPSTSSTQYSICFAQSGNSGDKIELKDSSGNTVSSFTTNKAYSAVLISNSSLKSGETYTLYVNGTQSSSQEITSIVTSNVSSGMQGGGMMGRPEGNGKGGMQGGFGGGRR